MLTRQLLFCTLISLCLTSFFPSDILAQHTLRFYHRGKQKQVVVRPGDILKLEYAGYLRQPEVLENRVIQIGGEAIILGQTVFGMPVPETQRTVMLSDVAGFRRFSRLRNTLKATAQIGSAVGTLLLFREVIDRNRLSTTSDIFLTLGVGIGSTILIDLLFPKKVKNKMYQGWEYEIY